MSRSKEPKSLPRREFLKAAGVTTGVAGAAALAVSPAKAVMVSESEGKKTAYRETEHVRKYYELAR